MNLSALFIHTAVVTGMIPLQCSPFGISVFLLTQHRPYSSPPIRPQTNLVLSGPSGLSPWRSAHFPLLPFPLLLAHAHLRAYRYRSGPQVLVNKRGAVCILRQCIGACDVCHSFLKIQMLLLICRILATAKFASRTNLTSEASIASQGTVDTQCTADLEFRYHTSHSGATLGASDDHSSSGHVNISKLQGQWHHAYARLGQTWCMSMLIHKSTYTIA